MMMTMMMMTADDKFSWSQLGQLGRVGLVFLVDGCWLLMMVRVLSNHGQMRGAWVYVSISAGPSNPFKLVAVELSFVMFSCRILVIFWLRDWAGPGSLLWCQQPSLWMNIFNQRMRGPKFGQAHVLLRFYCPIRIRMKYKTLDKKVHKVQMPAASSKIIFNG